MKTILCIDDDSSGLTARTCLLRAVGYDVLTATTGHDGIMATHTHAPDAIVLDYRLPDIDGEEVLRELRETHPTLPVILLSGMLDLPNDVRAEASAVVIKGEGAQKLLDALTEQLKGKG